MNKIRNKAWRRFTDHIHNNKNAGSSKKDKPEKQWKQIGSRRNKLLRARQLGFDYPIITQRQLLNRELFSNEA